MKQITLGLTAAFGATHLLAQGISHIPQITVENCEQGEGFTIPTPPEPNKIVCYKVITEDRVVRVAIEKDKTNVNPCLPNSSPRTITQAPCSSNTIDNPSGVSE